MATFDREHIFTDSNLAQEEDPWLGRLLAVIVNKVPASTAWRQLLIESTHINWLVTANKSWRLVPDKVKDKLRQGRIIVNMSADPFRGWEQRTVAELATYTDNFVVLSGDCQYYINPQPHICYVPFWYLNQKYTYECPPVIDKPRTHALSCLNKVSRYHRIENFMKLRQKPYFKDILFGMLYEYDAELIRRQTPVDFYNKQIVAEFERLIPAVSNNSGVLNGHVVDLPAFTDSRTNYVTETSIFEGTVFLSEKTWKPLMSGQLGIWLSNPGTVNFLRHIGFDMFDEVFQNHFYDKENNLNKRIDALHSIIDAYMNIDSAAVFEQTLARRKTNLEWFYSQELEQRLVQQCNNFSNMLTDHC